MMFAYCLKDMFRQFRLVSIFWKFPIPQVFLRRNSRKGPTKTQAVNDGNGEAIKNEGTGVGIIQFNSINALPITHEILANGIQET